MYVFFAKFSYWGDFFQASDCLSFYGWKGKLTNIELTEERRKADKFMVVGEPGGLRWRQMGGERLMRY